MRQRRLRSHLITLVLIALVPVLVFSAIVTVLLGRGERWTIERGLWDTARALALAVDRELTSAVTTLEAMAASDALDSGDLRTFYEDAVRILPTQTDWLTVSLADPTGHRLLDLSRPFGATLPPSRDQSSFDEVLRTRRPVVGDLSPPSVSPPHFVVRVPVVRHGVLKYVLSAAIRHTRMNAVMGHQKLDRDLTASILDGRRAVVARTPGSREVVGTAAGPLLSQAPTGVPEGWVSGTDREGVASYAAFARSGFSGWTVALAVRASAIDAPLRRSLASLIAGGATMLLAGVALALLVGGRIASSLASLAAWAQRLERGEFVSPPPASTIREVDELASAFVNAGLARKNAAEALRVTLTSIGDGVIATDTDGRIAFMNPVAEALTGFTRAEAVGQPLSDVVRVVDEESRHPLHLELGASRALLVARDGRELPVDNTWAPIRDQRGHVTGAVVVLRDVTDRRRADAELRESEARFRLLADTAPVLVWMSGPDGQSTFFNKPWLEFTGRRLEEELGRGWMAGLHPADLDRCRRAWQSAFDRRDKYTLEYRLRRADGQYRWVLDEAIPRFAPDRSFLGYIGGCLDITDRQQAEEERTRLLAREREARADAEAATRAKDDFIAVLSHELRTPLQSMLGWLGLLRSGQLGGEAASRALEVVERNTRLQAQLIEDLLDVSRIITGNLRLNVRPVELPAVVQAAINMVGAAADAKAIRLQTALDPSVGAVPCDPDRLQQIVWNLLSNAIKFTPKAGLVEVRLSRTESDALITITDSGQGITPEFLPHVFDRFQQAEKHIARGHRGLGIGLAIVRHLAELHGGEVRAESEGHDRGATFTVRLPLVSAGSVRSPKPGSMAGTEPMEAAAPDLNGVRVLVVDDEADARDVLTIMLRGWGAAVTAVGSAAAGLETLRAARPDVLVSDIGMPDEDGYVLIRNVRNLAAADGGRTPALALTAYAGGPDRDRALAAGYDVHLSKPVETAALARAVASLVGRVNPA